MHENRRTSRTPVQTNRSQTYFPRLLTFLCTCVLLLSSVSQAQAASHHVAPGLVGPKSLYLALGDSLAFGYQPYFDYNHGYADDFYANLQSHGVKSLANMGCVDETSSTFIYGGCPFSTLRKYPYDGPQLAAALNYLTAHAGQVSPVTLDIGANDFLLDINLFDCSLSSSFHNDLAALDMHLKTMILPDLHNALMVNGQLTGDLVMMNYYDPFQNLCPNLVPDIQLVNKHLAADVQGFGTIVNVFGPFGGKKTPNPHICTYTWMCDFVPDIHATDTGYSVIATAFEQGTGY